MSLTEIIIEEIRKKGPISFHDFMEMALYYPEYGYYTSRKNRIGKDGDYYTSPYATALFGSMLAKQIEQMWEIMKPKEFTIVEFGAGSGLLAIGIIAAIEKNQKLYQSMQYHMIEKNLHNEIQSISIEKLHWHETIDELPEITGCILSNEAIDNFPVHLVEMKDDLMEIFINYENGFIEQLQPATEELKQYFEELHIELPKGFRAEINLDAINWVRKIAPVLKKGFIITIDYGFSSSEIYSNKRCEGTLVCYHKHRINFCPLINIGEQDITTHINFSALHHWGVKNGLQFCGFTTQSNFLLSLGLCDYLRETEKTDDNSFKNAQQKSWLLHTFLMEMGQKLKVLVQSKGTEFSQLTGLRISQQLL
jgi:SAM-dependent MidA family methyltransferase